MHQSPPPPLQRRQHQAAEEHFTQQRRRRRRRARLPPRLRPHLAHGRDGAGRLAQRVLNLEKYLGKACRAGREAARQVRWKRKRRWPRAIARAQAAAASVKSGRSRDTPAGPKLRIIGERDVAQGVENAKHLQGSRHRGGASGVGAATGCLTAAATARVPQHHLSCYTPAHLVGSACPGAAANRAPMVA